MTKITCITTTFNEEELLSVSISSILNQTYSNFEYIIVDDGSGRRNLDILYSINDPRVKIVTQANGGLSAARNKGIEQATGDYICFLDADDCRPFWSFEAIAETIERDEPDVIFLRGSYCDEREGLGPFFDSDCFNEIERLCPQLHIFFPHRQESLIRSLAQMIEPQSANKVVRTQFLRNSKLGFPNTHFFEDIYFHTSLVQQAKSFSFINNSCFCYFKRYMRPQITASNSRIRFDIIPVSRITLDMFTKSEMFCDPNHRAAVVASCLKLLLWCESTVSHAERRNFQFLFKNMLELIDPAYVRSGSNLPQELLFIEPYLGSLAAIRTERRYFPSAQGLRQLVSNSSVSEVARWLFQR